MRDERLQTDTNSTNSIRHLTGNKLKSLNNKNRNSFFLKFFTFPFLSSSFFLVTKTSLPESGHPAFRSNQPSNGTHFFLSHFKRPFSSSTKRELNEICALAYLYIADITITIHSTLQGVELPSSQTLTLPMPVNTLPYRHQSIDFYFAVFVLPARSPL